MAAVPLPLRARLGEDATTGLVELFESERQEMLSLATERFERRLGDELSALRVEMHQGLAGLRGEIGAVRVEMHEALAGLRGEIGGVRVEMHQALAGLHGEMGGLRAELLKWSFLFWVGQVAAMAGLLAFMLRR